MASTIRETAERDALNSDLLNLKVEPVAMPEAPGELLVDLSAAEGVRALTAYLQNLHLGFRAPADGADGAAGPLTLVTGGAPASAQGAAGAPAPAGQSAGGGGDDGRTAPAAFPEPQAGGAAAPGGPVSQHFGSFVGAAPIAAPGPELARAAAPLALASEETAFDASGLGVEAQDSFLFAARPSEPAPEAPAPEEAPGEETPGEETPREEPETPPEEGPAAPSNTAPGLTEEFADQSVNEDAAFTYDAAAHFADPDAGDALTYSLGAGAPDWLSIDPDTGALSGTPENEDVGAAAVTVIATDGAGETAEADFTLTVDNTNDAPTGITFTPVLTGAFLEQDGLLVVEAEHYVSAHTGDGHAWGASETEGAMHVDDGAYGRDTWASKADVEANAPELTYTVHFSTPGTYYVHIRGTSEDGPSGNADSVHIGLDGERLTGNGGVTGFRGSDMKWGARDTQTGEAVKIVVTEPGTHELNLWPREDGVAVDKIVLTQDPDYRPSGEGPPESPRGDVLTLEENAASGAVVSQLSALDPDAADSHTYELVDADGDPITHPHFEIVGDEIRVKAGADLDFEAGAVDSISVKVTDASGASHIETVEVSLTDVNEAPTDIALEVAGRAGLSLNEDGGNSAYLISNDAGAALADQSAFTVEVTFSISQEASNQTPLLSYAAPDHNNEFLVVTDTRTETIKVFFRGQQIDTGIDKAAVVDGELHTISVVRDAADGSLDVWIDGVLEFEGSGIFTGQDLRGGGALVVGQEQDSVGGRFAADQVFSGTLNEIRVFNEARSADEIADHACETFDCDGSTLTALWDFSQYSNGVVADASGAGLTMTVGEVTGSGWAPGAGPVATGVFSEHSGEGTVVGSLSATDPDAGGSMTYEVVGASPFTVDGDKLVVAAGASFDHETEPELDVTIRVTDQDGLSVERTLTVAVPDANDAPTDLDLEEPFVNEGAAGAVISEVFVDDVDDGAGDFFFTVSDARFEVVEGQGATPFLKLKDGVSLDHETEPSITFDLTVTDADGAAYTERFTIAVEDNPETPTDVTLSSTSFDEGVYDRVDVVVGELGAVDEDAGDSFTYSIVDDPTGMFWVEDGQLMLPDGAYDHETVDSYDVTVRATDSTGRFVDQSFTIQVADVNEAPEAITLSATSFDEGDHSRGDVEVGALGGVDQDAKETFKFEIVGDASGLFFVEDGKLMAADGLYDHETTDAYDIRIRMTDTGGHAIEQDFTIAVNDVNEAPTAIWLEDTSMAENNAGADHILIASVDPDAGDWRASWSVSDDRFEVFDDDGEYTLKLKDGAALDYETEQEVTFTLTATDEGGASYDQLVTLTVRDVAEHVLLDDAGGAFVESGVQELSVSGGAGADSILGGSEDDLLAGGLGADTIDGGDGYDTLDYSDAGAGVEIYFGSSESSSASPTQTPGGVAIDADGSVDSFSNMEAAITTDYADWVYGGAGGNTVELRGGDDTFDNQSAASGADNVDGGAGADTLKAGGGSDTLRGGEGDDFLDGEQDADLLYGGAGADTVEGGHGGDTLSGDDGNDSLLGQAGDDSLDGGLGFDTLSGGGGADTITVGDGDIASGDDGADLFLISGNVGGYQIDGGAGWEDVISIATGGGGSSGSTWTVELSDGSVHDFYPDLGASALDFGEDVSGVITNPDGIEIDFTNIERIEWT